MPRSGPSSATRARRLLALLHLLERDTRYSLEAIASMLGATVSEVTQDLDALACCGVGPYYPDQLVPIFVEDGVVEVFGDLPALERGVRLSAREAHALAAALQTAGMPAEDPLTSRLLAAAAPPDVAAADMERVLRAATTPGIAPLLSTIAAGHDQHRVVLIAYRSAGTETETKRQIEPLALITERGAWYVEAFCRRAGALRTFRIDRMRSAELTAETFSPRRLTVSGAAFSTEDLPVARLHFAPGEEFSGRDWPGARVYARHEDGSFEVEVPFAGTDWLARHIAARLGGIEALSPVELREATARLADSSRS